MYSVPYSLIRSTKFLSFNTLFVSILSKKAMTITSSLSFRKLVISPIPGAPGLLLISNPPKYSAITVPKPVPHSISAICAI